MTNEVALRLALDGKYAFADELIIAALKRQIPIKPIEEQGFKTCPKCGCQEIEHIDTCGIRQYPYCPCCAQAIQWEEENED